MTFENPPPKKKPPPRKHRRGAALRVVLWLALLAAVLLAVITFLVYRDEIDAVMLSRVLPSIRLPGVAREEAVEQLAYDPLEDNVFSLAGDSLCILNQRRLTLCSAAGKELVGRSLTFSRPTLCAAERFLLAYDRGGGSLFLLDDRGIQLEKAYDRPILSARVNRKGLFAVVSEEAGFKAVAEVFDKKGEKLFRVQSPKRYLTDAVPSADGGRLAVAGLEQEGSRFLSGVTVYSLKEEEPLFHVEFPDELVLAVSYPDNNHIVVLLETSVAFFDRDGKLLSQYFFGDKKFLGGAFAGESFVAFRLGRYLSSVRNELIILDLEGGELLCSEAREPILGMSAAGGFLSVLVTGSISVYDDTGALVGEAAVSNVRSILQREDGSVMTLGLGQAKRVSVDS